MQLTRPNWHRNLKEVQAFFPFDFVWTESLNWVDQNPLTTRKSCLMMVSKAVTVAEETLNWDDQNPSLAVEK